MKENHLFTFNQFLLFLAIARACVQLSVRGQGGERQRVLSGAVRKYICQQRGRDQSERKEVAVTVASYLLMALDCFCLGKSLPRGKSGKVSEERAQLWYLWLLPVASCSQVGLLSQGSSWGSLGVSLPVQVLDISLPSPVIRLKSISPSKVRVCGFLPVYRVLWM